MEGTKIILKEAIARRETCFLLLYCTIILVTRAFGLGGGCWGVGGGPPRGPHLLAITQNAPIPKCPKMPLKCPKMPPNMCSRIIEV